MVYSNLLGLSQKRENNLIYKAVLEAIIQGSN